MQEILHLDGRFKKFLLDGSQGSVLLTLLRPNTGLNCTEIDPVRIWKMTYPAVSVYKHVRLTLSL